MSHSSVPLPNAKTSGHAVWSLILGILSCTCLWLLGSIPAIILGIMAIKAVDQSEGKLRGRGLGIAGIATGGVGILVGWVFAISIVGALTVPVAMKVKEKSDQQLQLSRTRLICLNCVSYALDHEGEFPETLQHLSPQYLPPDDLKMPIESGEGTVESVEFLYRRGLTDSDARTEPVIAGGAPIGGMRSIGYLDAKTELIAEEVFQERFAEYFSE